MKEKNIFKSHSHRKMWHRLMALTLVNPILPSSVTATTKPGPLFSGDINLTEAESKENIDNSIHFIIRHWQSAQDPAGNESIGDSYTIVVEGYIVPNNGGYHYYSRAFNRLL